MSRHEDICIEACGRLHSLQPVKAVAIVHEQKLARRKNLTQIDNPVLRNIDQAVASCVSTTQIKNLDFLATEIERDPVPERLIGKPGFLFLWRRFVPLHL